MPGERPAIAPPEKTPEQTRAEETQEAWQRIREAAGEAAGSCSVFRIVDGKRDVHLGNVDVEDIDDDPYHVLRSNWGGGAYLVVLRDSRGTFIANSRVKFYLDGKPKEAGDEGELEAIEAQLAELARDRGGMDTALVLGLLQEQGRMTRELLKPREDTGGGVVEILAALSPLLAPVIDRLLEPKDRLEEIQAILDIARNMQEPRDGMGQLAKTLGEPIADLVKHRTGQANPPAAADAAAHPQPTPGGAPVGAPNWHQFLAPLLPRALGWAQAGKDPELRADVLLEDLPDEQLGMVYSILSDPNFRGEFFRTFPAAAAHTEWFDTLFRRLAGGIMPPEEVDRLAAIEAAKAEASEGGDVAGELAGEEEPEQV